MLPICVMGSEYKEYMDMNNWINRLKGGNMALKRNSTKKVDCKLTEKQKQDKRASNRTKRKSK